uniref:Wali2 protein n=1 Tax=Triticum aestivum TaxID=4565 RepID=Q43662_WHEAT|nr:wali2 [Triticum aestivum]
MGMCSDKKRSSPGVALWCVVLGIALLVVDAAGSEGRARAGQLAEEHGDAAYCSALCKGRSQSDFGPCYNECLYGRVTGQEEARGAGGVGGPAGLLEMPTKRVGREEEEKTKQGDATVRLSDPVWCYDACREHPELDYNQCVNDCYAENMPDAAWLVAHGGTGGEEARGGVVDVPMGVVQHEAAAGALSRGNCDEYCRKHYDEGSPGYRHCQYMCPRLRVHGVAEGEEARGGAVDGLTVVGKPHCDWFRDCSVTPCVWRCGKRVQEEDNEGTRTGALNVLAAARHEVAVGACSSTVYVQSCYACCQREVTRDPDFDWYACIRSCDDKDAIPIKKERENKKDGVVPPVK